MVPEIIPPSARVLGYMPKMQDIPAEFKDRNNPWVKLTREWFFRGLKKWMHAAKPGIDHNVARWHLTAIIESFEPAHEHKTAAVAYLMSLWYVEGRVEEPRVKKVRPKTTIKQELRLGKPYVGPLRGGMGNDPAPRRS